MSAALEYVLLVHSNLFEGMVVQAILKYYVLNVIVKKSPINIFSPVYFQLNYGESVNRIAHQRTIFKV